LGGSAPETGAKAAQSRRRRRLLDAGCRRQITHATLAQALEARGGGGVVSILLHKGFFAEAIGITGQYHDPIFNPDADLDRLELGI
jgi:hypothetical protein